MLPLASKTMPSDNGTSSAPNCVISWVALFSSILKCSFSSPVTKRPMGSVTVTLIRTSGTSTLMVDIRAGSAVWEDSEVRFLREILASAVKAGSAAISEKATPRMVFEPQDTASKLAPTTPPRPRKAQKPLTQEKATLILTYDLSLC